MIAGRALWRPVRLVSSAMLGLVLQLAATAAHPAAYFRGLVDSNWSSAGNWSNASCAGAIAGGVPALNDDVTICSGTTVLVDVSAPTVANANRVIIEAGATLQGGSSTSTLLIDNTPAISLASGGTFTPQSGTVRLNRNGNTTVATGTASSIALNNLLIDPSLGGNRTYTLADAAGGSSITQMTIGGSFDVTPPSAGGIRTLTVTLGKLAAFTVAGTLQLDAGGNERVTFNNVNSSGNAIAISLGRLELGGSGTGNQTFNADAGSGSPTVTLNAGSGTLLARNSNGVFTANGSTVRMNAPASVTLTSGTLTFNDLAIDMAGQTGTLGGAITVSGDLAIAAGTLADGGFQIAGNGSGTMTAASGTFLRLGTSASATAFPTLFTNANIALNAGSTVIYNSDQPQAVSATPAYGNLALAATAAVTKTAAGALNIDGSFTIGATNTFNAGAFSHTLAGSFTDDGTFNGSTGGLTLDGSSAQVLGGSSESVFNNLTLDNAAGAALGSSKAVGGTLTLTTGTLAVGAHTLSLDGPAIAGTPANLSTTSSSSLVFGGSAAGVELPSSVAQLDDLTLENANGLTLNGSPAVNGTLTFVSGDLATETHTLTLAAAATVSGPGAAGHVVGNLQRVYAAAGSFTYPLGDGTNYTPLVVELTALGSTGSLTAAVIDDDHPNTTGATSGIDAESSVNRYWTLKDATLAGTASLTFNYVGGNPVDNDGGSVAASFVVRRGETCSGSGGGRACIGGWASQTLSGAPTTTQATVTGVAIASGAAEADFAIGEPKITPFQREKEFIYSRELY